MPLEVFRELTKVVLYYYRGDILDELPDLVDFSVFRKKSFISWKPMRSKENAVGTALYMHPCLSEIS